jgi:hypothetical protein
MGDPISLQGVSVEVAIANNAIAYPAEKDFAWQPYICGPLCWARVGRAII